MLKDCQATEGEVVRATLADESLAALAGLAGRAVKHDFPVGSGREQRECETAAAPQYKLYSHVSEQNCLGHAISLVPVFVSRSSPTSKILPTF